jgi:hypothetical protein
MDTIVWQISEESDPELEADIDGTEIAEVVPIAHVATDALSLSEHLATIDETMCPIPGIAVTAVMNSCGRVIAFAIASKLTVKVHSRKDFHVHGSRRLGEDGHLLKPNPIIGTILPWQEDATTEHL